MRVLFAIVVAGLSSGAGLAGAAELANGIRAVVGDTVITDLAVQEHALQAILLLRRQYADKPEVFRQKATETLENALQQLMERQLIVHEFKAAGYNMPQSILDDAVRARIRQQFDDDRMTMIKSLQREGRTEEKFRQQVREQLVVAALAQKNISSALIISPHKMEVYYQAHQDKYKVDDEVKLRVIVLDSTAAATAEGRKRLAGDILTKVKEGADFAQMAAVYSTGSQKKEGGDWGWVERSFPRKELADAAFALATKQVSGVVETPDACYLALVEDKRPAHVRPLNEVRDDIEQTLMVEERARLQKKYVDKLWKKTFTRKF